MPFENQAKEIVRNWIEKHGNFVVTLENDLTISLVKDLLVEVQKTADANELLACRHERTLVAEELFILLSVIGVGPDNRHSSNVKYNDKDFQKLHAHLMEVIGNSVPGPNAYEIETKLNKC